MIDQYVKYLILVILVGWIMGVRECAAATPYTPRHADPVQEFWRWRAFPELKGQGLSCLAQDRDGNFLFGTDNGIHRYDGTSWRVFPFDEGIVGPRIYALYAARDGSIYVGSDQGIARFENGTWERVFPSRGDYRWFTYDLTEAEDGSLWAGTEWGALRMTPGGTSLYVAAEDTTGLRHIVPDAVTFVAVPDRVLPKRAWGVSIGAAIVPSVSESDLIVKVAGGGPAERAGLKVGDRVLSVEDDVEAEGKRMTVVQVQRVDGQVDTIKLQKERISAPEQRFRVYDVCDALNGTIWFGGFRGELVRFDSASGYQRFDRGDGIDQGMYPRICVTEDGIVWVVYGDNSKSINRFDGEKWEALEVGDLGRGHHYTSILESRDGTLWIGGSRLIAHKDGVWRVYDPKETAPLPGHRTKLLEAADGALWIIGRGEEAVRLDLSETHWQTYEGLIFQCDTPDGAQWFISQDNGVVRYDGKEWTRFGVEDGLMDAPSKLIVTRKGVLWAAGSHEHIAATARLDGSEWILKRHFQLSWSIDPRAVYEAFDGTLWFAAAVDWWLYEDRDFLGGVVVFDGTNWTHHPFPSITSYAYGIGQSADGTLWFGGRLVSFDGTRRVRFIGPPEELANDFIDAVYTTPQGDLWLGSRTYGVFRYDGTAWQRFDYQDGLADNRVRSIFQDRDGAIWVGTAEGVSRYDGRTWFPNALPPGLPLTEFYDPILQSRDGTLYLNSASDADAWRNRSGPQHATGPYTLRTIRYVPETDPPETIMTIDPGEAFQGGKITFAWTGADPWQSTLREDLQYAYRLDGGEWSPYGADMIRSFEDLDVGTHTLEVKARDLAFNEDPTPAMKSFNVVPVVWRRPWFIGLILGFVTITGYLITRIIVRDRRLRQSNEELRQTMDERARLDDQLQNLRYLYRLRSELDGEKSPRAVIQRAGAVMMTVLNGAANVAVCVSFDGQQWEFGDGIQNGLRSYTRAISIAGKERGRLELHCGIEFTEGQERALLDETAGQLARTLEARELEMQLLQSARLVSLGQMAAGVAHELNQPLAVVETTAGDICRRLMGGVPLDTDELREMMEDVRGVVDRMAGTVDHLRVFSRDVSEEPRQAMDVNEVIKSSLKLMRTQLDNHGVDLALDLSDALPEVWGHPHPLEQVVLNLLSNARDTVDERAEMEGAGYDKRIQIRTRAENDAVVIEVEDNGVGMDEVTRQRLFEPFFTTKDADQGTGLGLSIIYAIVRNHDGEIAVESEQGVGTTFRVMLPVVEKSYPQMGADGRR